MGPDIIAYNAAAGAPVEPASRERTALFMLHRLYRRLRYGEPIVVVSGLPRSGTSMVMKMLQAGGMPIVADGLRAADEDNPRGYFEDERVKNMARAPDRGWLRDARGGAIKIVTYLLKELPHDNNYKVLILRRDLVEVVASQNKMLGRRGESTQTTDARAIELLETDLWRAQYLVRRASRFESLEVHYREVIEHPVKEARRIASFVGGGLDIAAMAAVVERQLYRNRAGSPSP